MKTITVVTFICLAVLAGCAAQEEIVSLDSRMSEIEMREAEERKKRQELLESTKGSDQALRQQSASIRAQIEELREEVRLLTGRLDEIDYAIKQQDAAAVKSGQSKMDELEQLANNNDDRLKKLEQYLNLETAAAAKPPSKIKAGDQAPQPSSEKDVYNSAKMAFDQGELEIARKGFEGFIKRFPRSGNADNAQFWIGEIYYRDKWYEKAILEYQKVIENYPKGNKVPASLLKQGLAFLNIGDKDNSRLILQELVRKYPKSNEANVAAEKLKTLK